jgi:hypothetical protein
MIKFFNLKFKHSLKILNFKFKIIFKLFYRQAQTTCL